MRKKKSEKEYLVYYPTGDGVIGQEDVIGVFGSLKEIEEYFLEEIRTGSMNEDEAEDYIIRELGKRVAMTYSKIEKITFTE